MQAMLQLENIKKSFIQKGNRIEAVKDVSFALWQGEALGLVGESGCGKSTIGKIIAQLLPPDSGCMQWNGAQEHIQMVFQNPIASFNPRRKLGESVMEPLLNQHVPRNKAKERMLELFNACGLAPAYTERYPHQVSGGECQRAAIARAVMVMPKLLICDEATSSLDVTVQAAVIELLASLKRTTQLSFLFISHDLALVQKFCDRVLVMRQGEILEEGTPQTIIENPQNEYTKRLVDSVFLL
ncbi:MAG: ABC transporter ATP-binding protein [Lachnospiraceae bacterium]